MNGVNSPKIDDNGIGLLQRPYLATHKLASLKQKRFQTRVVSGQRVFEKINRLNHKAQESQECPGHQTPEAHGFSGGVAALSRHQNPAIFSIGDRQLDVRRVGLNQFFFLAL